MKIKISKYNQFEVDPVDLPGSPKIGRGRTMLEALGSFLICYQDALNLTIEVDETAKPAEKRRRRRELSKR